LKCYFYPGKKYHESHAIVKVDLPVAEKIKIKIFIIVLQETLKSLWDFELPEKIKRHADNSQCDQDYVHKTPDPKLEVLTAKISNLRKIKKNLNNLIK